MKYLFFGLAALTVLLILYFGYIELVGKTMKSDSGLESTYDAEALQKKQTDRVTDVMERQRRLMEDQKTRMKDLQRL